jgi:arylsulfatase A-like enzyme
MVAARDPGPAAPRWRRALGAAGDAMATALDCQAALALAWLVLRVAETAHASAAGVKVGTLFGPALANDLLALLRHAFVLLVGAIPLALLPRRGWRVAALGAWFALLTVVDAGLIEYHWTAGVPLGADLFGYSRAEIATTAGGRMQVATPLVAALAGALLVLALVLRVAARPSWPGASRRAALAVCAASLAAFRLAPDHFTPPAAVTEASVDYLRNKMAYFVDRSIAYLAGGAVAAPRANDQAQGGLPWSGRNPSYPFLHADRTPDTLGPLFEKRAATPPNLVFIIVEGLGRDFSGPGARLGSFTPFLDELAKRSLYFDNFLSGQGRTFGVLTTIFGSLPFGENGLAALGERMPRHASLLTILKQQGYRLHYYSGSNLEFDNQGAFLKAEGVDHLTSDRDFAPPHQRAGYWGYADRDLVETALARQAADTYQPSLSIIQTITMHDPFEFPGREAYRARVGQRLAALGIAAGANPGYTGQRDIFASILYTDDALRLYFQKAAQLPGYDNTLFIITGDHRLPDLPMDTRIGRYHVPLIIYSPLLKAPREIKAVSSQFDIAPSLLSFLAHGYGLRTPGDVTWLGTGLDTAPEFRNLHAIPLKQTKTELADFVSGTVYLAQDQLYALADGMQVDRTDDTAAIARARAQFQSFVAANRLAGKAAALAPQGAGRLAAYRDDDRVLKSTALASEAGQVSVSGVRKRPGAGDAVVTATLRNAGATTSAPFVPLLVVSDERGFEVTETAGEPQTLAPGASLQVALAVHLGRVPHGTYFVSVLPSHPETAKPVGIGQYHVQMGL